jgi:hypothetical protein
MAALVMDAGRRNDGGMADPSHGSKSLRVLLSEGSSTSAIPHRFASAGFRGSSANFIAVRAFATIPPAICGL